MIMQMGLYFLITGLSSLDVKAKFAFFHSLGNSSFIKSLFIILVTASVFVFPNIFAITGIIPSGPGAFPSLSRETALFTSFTT